VVINGFGDEPLMLITKLPLRARDSQSLWWVVQIYVTHWKIKEIFPFVLQSYNLEYVRVMKHQRLKNLVALVTAVTYFAATFLAQQMKRAFSVRSY
jgi:hypothetical protein